MSDDLKPETPGGFAGPHGSAAWTGQRLHAVWAESCQWSSVGFKRDWDTMHPHLQEKWNELAKAVNGEAQPNR